MMPGHNIFNVPVKLVLRKTAAKSAREQLTVKGQGVVEVVFDAIEPFTIRVSVDGDESHGYVELSVDRTAARIVCVPPNNQQGEEIVYREITREKKALLDPDVTCKYWFSLDPFNLNYMYGKGEMRLLDTLLTLSLEEPEQEDGEEVDPVFAWLPDLKEVKMGSPVQRVTTIWRDPVTVDPPLIVLPPNRMTMDAIAANTALTAASLPSACLTLASNIAGMDFQLDTEDFPDFSEAINFSINNPNGICYKILESKSGEFGDDPNESYLRITLGINQGNSPGIPYVLEIWPIGHYSPIHNHAGANAIIKVLHGEITVNLFNMLSKDHTDPIARRVFRKDEVTWITPELNQTHQLYNYEGNTSACMTIQCYQYGEDNNVHYEYFDYLDEETGEICQFTPNSDMGFLEFKARIREEWMTGSPILKREV